MTSWIFELHYRNSSVGRTPNGKKIAADKVSVAVTDRGHGNILGGAMVGTHAGDMIGEIALAIVGRCAPSPSSRTVSTSGTYSTPSGRTQNPRTSPRYADRHCGTSVVRRWMTG